MGIHAGFVVIVKCPRCGDEHEMEFQNEGFDQSAKWKIGDRLYEWDWKYYPPEDLVEEYQSISNCNKCRIFVEGTVVIVGGIFKEVKDIKYYDPCARSS